MTPLQFAREIIQRRKALGMTQAQAAQTLGVSMRTYCYWERGERIPPSEREPAATRESVIRALRAPARE